MLHVLTTSMHRPGYAPGHPAWKADMLLSHPRCSIYQGIKKIGMNRTLLTFSCKIVYVLR